MSINLQKLQTQNKTKLHLMTHHRHKSQIKQRQNPWDQIGKALTYRYNQKYNEITRKSVPEDNSFQLESLKMRAPIPKFKIKRKYLSFNFDPLDKKKQNNLEESRKPLQIQTSSLSKSKRKLVSFSSNQYYKTVRQSLNMINNKIQSSPRAPMLPQNVISTFSGVYLVPSTSHFNKQKHKGVYVKKSKWKMNMNPQLRISKKKREIKEGQDILCSTLEYERNKVTYLHEGFRPKRKEDIYRLKPQQKKMFRPWSGYSDEQNQ